MVTRYGQADIPREVSGRGRPAVGPAAADFPRDVCLTVSRNHKVFLLYVCVYMIFPILISVCILSSFHPHHHHLSPNSPRLMFLFVDCATVNKVYLILSYLILAAYIEIKAILISCVRRSCH